MKIPEVSSPILNETFPESPWKREARDDTTALWRQQHEGLISDIKEYMHKADEEIAPDRFEYILKSLGLSWAALIVDPAEIKNACGFDPRDRSDLMDWLGEDWARSDTKNGDNGHGIVYFFMEPIIEAWVFTLWCETVPPAWSQPLFDELTFKDSSTNLSDPTVVNDLRHFLKGHQRIKKEHQSNSEIEQDNSTNEMGENKKTSLIFSLLVLLARREPGKIPDDVTREIVAFQNSYNPSPRQPEIQGRIRANWDQHILKGFVAEIEPNETAPHDEKHDKKPSGSKRPRRKI